MRYHASCKIKKKPDIFSLRIIIFVNMNKLSSLALAALLSACFIPALAKDRTAAQAYLDRKLSEEPFRSGLVGVLAVKISGDTIAESGSLRKLIPASNTKLITTGLAIRGLGRDYRLSTALGYDGSVSDGVLHGDLYIVGGGDPTLASSDPGSLSADSLFSVWKSMLTARGIRRIDGRIIGDGRYLDGPIELDSWAYNDLGTFYGTGCNGLIYSRNILKVNVAPGNAEGSPVRVSNFRPNLPWLEFRNNSTTSAPGTGDQLYLFNTDLAPVCELRGSFASGKVPKTEEFSHKFGPLACSSAFSDYLRKNGVKVDGEPSYIDSYGKIVSIDRSGRGLGSPEGTARRVPDLHIIGDTESMTVREIARITNSRSDNLYAETLLRILSKERTGSASYDSCKVVIMRELASLGVDTSTGARIVDGSGLSRHDCISPDFFCRFLRSMYLDSGCFWDYLSTLSRPGAPGMKSCLAGKPDAVRSRIRMKSGSMDGVLCFSGYVMPVSDRKEDVTVFSVMTNNCPDAEDRVRAFVNELIYLIANEN